MASPERLLRELDAVLRHDFASFVKYFYPRVNGGKILVWNWHLDAICHRLQQVDSGSCKRLIIEIQPRSLKSFVTSVAFPAWSMGRKPSLKLITASYSQVLANQHASACRNIMRLAEYKRLFPGTSIAGKDTEADFRTTRGGARISTSTGATLTGRGGDIAILDDLQKPAEALSPLQRSSVFDWFRNTLYSRLDDKKHGAIVVVMQRLHLEDLAGRLREQGGWDILSLPAIATTSASIPLGPNRVHRRAAGDLLHPDREDQAILDQVRRDMGSYNFSAQYQQEPEPEEGSILKWQWFKFTDKNSHLGAGRLVQSWDIANKPGDTNDYCVCTTWWMEQDEYLLESIFRERLAFPDLHRAVIDLARQHQADTILIEDTGSGTPLIQQLSAKKLIGVPRPIPILPKLDKVTRMSSETPVIEAGQVSLLKDALWLEALHSEVVQFPNGRHDDQIDSISQFLIWARNRASRSGGVVKIVGRWR